MPQRPLPKLYTIGYGNRKPEAFLSLIPDGVRIFDVRATARGWSPLYSEKQLRKRFVYERDGKRFTRYRHFPALGNPEHAADSWEQPEGAELALNAAADILRRLGAIVLLCAELDANRCHRRFVAEEIARRVPCEIVHL